MKQDDFKIKAYNLRQLNEIIYPMGLDIHQRINLRKDAQTMFKIGFAYAKKGYYLFLLKEYRLLNEMT